MEENRPTKPTVEWLDADEYPPTIGQQIIGLTIGGVLIKTVLTEKNRQHVVAWMPYPKMSDALKIKLYNAYLGIRT